MIPASDPSDLFWYWQQLLIFFYSSCDFLVSGLIGDFFLLNQGHFVYGVWELWILFQSFILAVTLFRFSMWCLPTLIGKV